eukprot:10233-Heterococcus_DN1.PRE.4
MRCSGFNKSALQVVTLLLHSVSSQLQLSSSHLQSEGSVLGLWSHEACREIRDALHHSDDRKIFDDALVVALASHNGSTWLQGKSPSSLVYSNFADSSLEEPYDEQAKQQQQLIAEYSPVLSISDQKQTYSNLCSSLQKSDIAQQQMTTDSTSSSKSLGGYATYTVEAFTHSTRVTRTLQLPGGCMLMLPTSTTDAVGMTSAVVKLATHALGYKLIEAVIDNTSDTKCCLSQHTYSTFRAKLKDAMLCAGGASTSGAEQAPTVLYIKDISTSSNIGTLVHDYLKDIDEVLSNGVVHGLYTPEDVHRAERSGGLMIADDTAANNNANSSDAVGTDGTYNVASDEIDALSKLLRHQAAVLLNLHIVLCFTEPKSVQALQRRLKQYSYIHSRCCVDWVDRVYHNTLAALARDTVANSDIEAVVSIPQTIVDKLANLAATLHSIVNDSIVLTAAAHSTVPLTPNNVVSVMKLCCDAFAVHQKRVDEIALWQSKIADAQTVVNRMRNRAESQPAGEARDTLQSQTQKAEASLQQLTAYICRIGSTFVDAKGVLITPTDPAYISDTARLTAQQRHIIRSQWVAAAKDALMLPTSTAADSVSQQYGACALLEKPWQISTWTSNGIPHCDTECKETAAMLVTLTEHACASSSGCVMLLDPYAIASSWLKSLDTSKDMKTVYAQDTANAIQAIDTAVKGRTPLLVEGVTVHNAYRVLRAYTTARQQLQQQQSDQHDDKICARTVYFNTHQHQLDTSLLTDHSVTLVNMSVTVDGLVERLLEDVLKFTRPDLYDRA